MYVMKLKKNLVHYSY